MKNEIEWKKVHETEMFNGGYNLFVNNEKKGAIVEDEDGTATAYIDNRSVGSFINLYCAKAQLLHKLGLKEFLN